MLLLNKKNRSAINEVKFMAQNNSCKKKRNPARQLKVISLFTGYYDNKKCHRVWKILKCDHCQYWRYRLTDIRYSTDSNEYQCYIMFLTYFDIY